MIILNERTLNINRMEVKVFGVIKLKEFAKMLGVPESTVRTWKRRGDIPEKCFLTIGVTVFVKEAEAKAFMGV